MPPRRPASNRLIRRSRTGSLPLGSRDLNGRHLSEDVEPRKSPPILKTNSVLQRYSSLPLTRLMSISNDCFAALPCSDTLSADSPLRTMQPYSQVGISAKIRRLSVPSLWVCIMGLPDGLTGNHHLLQWALKSNVINDALCQPSSWTTAQNQL